MKVVNIYEAQAHFSHLLEEVQKGNGIIIAKDGHHVAEIQPILPKRDRVQYGLLKGQIKILGDIVGPDQQFASKLSNSL